MFIVLPIYFSSKMFLRRGVTLSGATLGIASGVLCTPHLRTFGAHCTSGSKHCDAQAWAKAKEKRGTPSQDSLRPGGSQCTPGPP